MNDIADRIRLTLAEATDMLELSSPPGLPEVPPAACGAREGRSRRRRHWWLAAATTLVVLPATGVAVAAVDGGFPWAGDSDHVVVAGSARVLVAAPGPDGTTFELWGASLTSGSYCEATTFSSDSDAAPTELGPNQSAQGAVCESSGDPASGPFNADGGGQGLYDGPEGTVSAEHPRWVSVFLVAGSATTAQIQLSDGTSLPASVSNHWIAAWMPWADTKLHPTLVAHDAQGHRVGRTFLN